MLADQFCAIHRPEFNTENCLSPIFWCLEESRKYMTIASMTTESIEQRKRAMYQEEAARLRAIWDATPNRPSQAEFGEIYNIGGQSAVNNFLRGTSPLSLKAAAGFAKGLNVSIAQFSTRLADQANALAEITEGGDADPSGRRKELKPGIRKYLVAIHDPESEEQIGMVMVRADGLSEAHDRGLRLIQQHQAALNVDAERVQTLVYEIRSMRPALWE